MLSFWSIVALIAISTQVVSDERWVFKCCPEGMSLISTDTRNCSDSSSHLLDPFEPLENYTTRFFNESCPSLLAILENYTAYEDGFLKVMGSFTYQLFKEEYCFDVYQDKIQLFTCDFPTTPRHGVLDVELHVFMIISVVLLVATALIYSLNKELRDNKHSPYLVSHVISLAMAFSCLTIVQLFPIENSDFGCRLLGIGMQYFFLVAFFWINVMCIDIYMTLRNMRPSGRRTFMDKRQFRYFSIYAWGTPILVVALTALFHFTDVIPSSSSIKPQFGIESCFLHGAVSTWLYFQGIIAIIVAANFVIYILTSVLLISHLNNATSLRSRAHREKSNYFLCLKLFIVMGISWAVELFSSQFEADYPSIVWYIADVINALQGLLIFILFVCKQSVLSILSRDAKALYAKLVPNKTKGADNQISETITVDTDDTL